MAFQKKYGDCVTFKPGQYNKGSMLHIQHKDSGANAGVEQARMQGQQPHNIPRRMQATLAHMQTPIHQAI